MPDSASLRPLLLAVLAFFASLRPILANLTDYEAADRLRQCDELGDLVRAAADRLQSDPATAPAPAGDQAGDLATVLQRIEALASLVQQLQQQLPAATPAPTPAPGGSENLTSTGS